MERMTIRNSDGSVSQLTDLKLAEALEKLADYEDNGMTPVEVHSMSIEWCAMMSVLNSMGSYARLRELAEADKDGRLVVLPCKVGGSMLDMSYPEKPSIMKRLHFAVAYENIDGVVYHQPWGIFTENIKAGYIKPNCGANLDGEAHGEE